LIRPQNWALLLADLRQRTGLPITRIEIGRLNFLRDTAEIHVYYDGEMLDGALVRLPTDQPVLVDNDPY
jgi:hypothetical protein